MDKRLAEPLERAGYTLTQEAKAQYLRGMTELLIDNHLVSALYFLRYDYMQRLFAHASLRKGNAYTVKELQQLANPSQNLPQFLKILDHLVFCHAFYRGYRLECAYCSLEWWYPLPELALEPIRCIGCRHLIALPLELNFAYRLNPLFALGINNGALTIFLALLALKPPDNQHYFYDFCTIARKGMLITDIDLLLRREDRFCLVECKDKLPETNELHDQLSKLAAIARDADADAYFATLAETVPQSILAFAADTQIRVLTQRELLK